MRNGRKVSMLDGIFNVQCKYCNNAATEKHHRFSQSKSNIRKYGRKLINDKRNLEDVCSACNSSHAVVKSINDREFCMELGIMLCRNCSWFYEDCSLQKEDYPDAENCRDFCYDINKKVLDNIKE